MRFDENNPFNAASKGKEHFSQKVLFDTPDFLFQ